MSDDSATSDELVVSVTRIEHLFVAPDADPLSPHESEVMGEPALLRVVRRLLAKRKLHGSPKLVVLLPEEQIAPESAERASAALRRYCALKLEDNENQLRILRAQALRLLLRGLLILVVCVGLSSLFRENVLGLLPPFLSGALGEGFNVLGWVMLWRPIEAYFFDPLPIRTSSNAHDFISALEVEIRPQSHADEHRRAGTWPPSHPG